MSIPCTRPACYSGNAPCNTPSASFRHPIFVICREANTRGRSRCSEQKKKHISGVTMKVRLSRFRPIGTSIPGMLREQPSTDHSNKCQGLRPVVENSLGGVSRRSPLQVQEKNCSRSEMILEEGSVRVRLDRRSCIPRGLAIVTSCVNRVIASFYLTGSWGSSIWICGLFEPGMMAEISLACTVVLANVVLANI